MAQRNDPHAFKMQRACGCEGPNEVSSRIMDRDRLTRGAKRIQNLCVLSTSHWLQQGFVGSKRSSEGIPGQAALMLGPHESLPTVHPTSSPAAGERSGTKIDPIQKPRPSDGVSGRAISMASLAVPPDDATTAALSVRPASLVEKRILLGQG
jgi:hypothetical protein